MKALEVSIDGEVVGIFVPPEGESFAAMVGNIPRTYMRAHIMSGTDTENWQWQLPDIRKGQSITFRMVEARPGSGIPPHFVRQRDPREVARTKRLAAKAHTRALKERAVKGSRSRGKRRKVATKKPIQSTREKGARG